MGLFDIFKDPDKLADKLNNLSDSLADKLNRSFDNAGEDDAEEISDGDLSAKDAALAIAC